MFYFPYYRTMINYNYELSVKESVLDRLDENLEPHILSEDEIDELRDKLYVEDSVTDNASGSYTMSTRHAKMHILEYLIDHETEFGDMIEDYAIDMGNDRNRRERLDVLMRCHTLDHSEAFLDAIQERYEEHELQSKESL